MPEPHSDVPRNTPRRRQIVIAGVAGVIALGSGLLLRRSFRGPDTNDILWQQTLQTPDGAPFRFDALRGHALLVNFWATWCVPCLREMPLLNCFYDANRATKLAVVGVAIDRAEAVRGFLRQTPVGYPIAIARDTGLDLARKLGNKAGVLPFSVAWDANGKIAAHHAGELDAARLAHWKSILLG